MNNPTEKLGHLSRRTFLRLAGMSAAGSLLAACATAPAGQPPAAAEAGADTGAATSTEAVNVTYQMGGPELTEAEIKTLAVDNKWLAALDKDIHGEMDRISQRLTQRVKELAERYETRLPRMVSRVAELEAKVNGHLTRMGFAWK